MQAADSIADLEARIQSLGDQLLEQAGREVQQAGKGWLDGLVDRAIQDREFRVQTLRFVDVLPTLQDDAPLVRATLRGLSRRFMGGSTLSPALETITRLRKRGMLYSLDLLAGLQQAGNRADRPEVVLV